MRTVTLFPASSAGRTTSVWGLTAATLALFLVVLTSHAQPPTDKQKAETALATAGGHRTGAATARVSYENARIAHEWYYSWTQTYRDLVWDQLSGGEQTAVLSGMGDAIAALDQASPLFSAGVDAQGEGNTLYEDGDAAYAAGNFALAITKADAATVKFQLAKTKFDAAKAKIEEANTALDLVWSLVLDYYSP